MKQRNELKKEKKRKLAAVKKRRMQELVRIRNSFASDPFYSSREWLQLRYRVLVSRGRRCEACGIEGCNVRFHVDHIKPRSKFPDLALNEGNLQVLCEACNIGKGIWDQTNWRTRIG
jgi:5-methylcytosine-specific restriction endonuclease McrA